MDELSEDIVNEAWSKWYLLHYDHKATDLDIEPFLNANTSGGWIKKAREASFLSVRELAKRLGITISDYTKFEKRENQGNISILTLRKFADAMDCELIYAFRPKSRKLFSSAIWSILLTSIAQWLPLNQIQFHQRSNRIVYLICRKLYDPRFRRAQGWAKNSRVAALEFTHALKAMRTVERTSNAFPRPPSP